MGQFQSWIKEEPAFYELLWGAWTTFLWLFGVFGFFINKYKFSGDHLERRLAAVHLAGSSAYLVNHYFGGAPFYVQMLGLYSIVFYAYWFYTISYPFEELTPRLVTFFLSFFYTLLFIFNENVARLLVKGTFFNLHFFDEGPLPEVLLQFVSTAVGFAFIKYFPTTIKKMQAYGDTDDSSEPPLLQNN